nr:hypothetical protein [Tanacetum cinerariifolium]
MMKTIFYIYELCSSFADFAPLPPWAQRHLWLRYEVKGYTKEIVQDYEQRLDTIYGRQVIRTLEKVTATDLFYLRSMDEGTAINIPYLLAIGELRVIDMDELVRLRICERLGDTWAWVAPRPERKPIDVAGAHRIDDNEMGLDIADTLCFQLGRVRRSMTLRLFILALRLYTIEEIARDGFEAYWASSLRGIADRGDLSD